MSNVKVEFGKRLKMVRLASKWRTQAAFAQAIGREEGAYGRWERGEVEPGLLDLQKIRETTGISLDFLVAGDLAGVMRATPAPVRLLPKKA